jgi:hypothetical protein
MSASFRESGGSVDLAFAALGPVPGPEEPKGGALLLPLPLRLLLSLLPLRLMFMKASAAFETASLIFSIALSLSISKAKSIQSLVSWSRSIEQE